MREHPWHIRSISAEHEQWYRNLIDLHALTLKWIQDLRLDRLAPAHLMKRTAVSDEIVESLWMLESIGPDATPLPALLDDTYPEDLLGRLERTVWAVQAWTLTNVLGKLSGKEKLSAKNQLEQSAWTAGRECAERRWPEIPETCRNDLRGVLMLLNNSPLSGLPQRSRFLTRRATARELRIELMGCPHQSPFGEVGPVKNELCLMHNQWIRGFSYFIHTQISIDYYPVGEEKSEDVRCHQKWTYLA